MAIQILFTHNLRRDLTDEAQAEFDTPETVESLAAALGCAGQHAVELLDVSAPLPEVMAKLAHAHRLGKPVDGHAPGLKGEVAKRYIAAGISTDHECFTREEALDKLACGMKILIREGSAAKNFDALIGLMHDHAEHLMFCSDDKHPDSLVLGHINDLCARAVALGHVRGPGSRQALGIVRSNIQVSSPPGV